MLSQFGNSEPHLPQPMKFVVLYGLRDHPRRVSWFARLVSKISGSEFAISVNWPLLETIVQHSIIAISSFSAPFSMVLSNQSCRTSLEFNNSRRYLEGAETKATRSACRKNLPTPR